MVAIQHHFSWGTSFMCSSLHLPGKSLFSVSSWSWPAKATCTFINSVDVPCPHQEALVMHLDFPTEKGDGKSCAKMSPRRSNHSYLLVEFIPDHGYCSGIVTWFSCDFSEKCENPNLQHYKKGSWFERCFCVVAAKVEPTACPIMLLQARRWTWIVRLHECPLAQQLLSWELMFFLFNFASKLKHLILPILSYINFFLCLSKHSLIFKELPPCLR